MNLTLDNDRLRQLIPGIIHEVKGETPLYNKILPWIEGAKQWLEEYFLGADFAPEEHNLYGLCEKIIVYKAMADAVPALDVVLSPAGFAVIDTDGRAPASKERVERLIASFRAATDSNTAGLVANLERVRDWRETLPGSWWCATFLPDLSEMHAFRKQGEALFDTYRRLRPQMADFEQLAEEDFFGRVTLTKLLAEQFEDKYSELIQGIRSAELRYISARLTDQSLRCPNPHEPWHLLRPIVFRLKYYPDLYPIWLSEMGMRFGLKDFENNTKGAFFF